VGQWAAGSPLSRRRLRRRPTRIRGSVSVPAPTKSGPDAALLGRYFGDPATALPSSVRRLATPDGLARAPQSPQADDLKWGLMCHRCGMTVQISVQLSEAMVAFLDDSVASGLSPSRSALVTSALEREMRRQLALHDAKILRDAGSDDDLDDLVAWSVSHADLGE
jgi:Arc/MetJ-type ribon-helix-helix transcriptional regulator